MLQFAILFVMLAALAMLSYIRFSPHDISRWHVNPLAATDLNPNNSFSLLPVGGDAVSPVYAIDAGMLTKIFDEFARRQTNVTLIAGAPKDRFVTYVQRTRAVGFPDYISVTAIDRGDGTSTLAIVSRSRFGIGDLGLNRARVKSWIQPLESFQIGQ